MLIFYFRQLQQTMIYFKASSTPAYLVLNDVHEVSLGDIQYQPNPVLSDEVVLPCASNGSSGVNSSATVQIPVSLFLTDYRVLLPFFFFSTFIVICYCVLQTEYFLLLFG